MSDKSLEKIEVYAKYTRLVFQLVFGNKNTYIIGIIIKDALFLILYYLYN